MAWYSPVLHIYHISSSASSSLAQNITEDTHSGKHRLRTLFYHERTRNSYIQHNKPYHTTIRPKERNIELNIKQYRTSTTNYSTDTIPGPNPNPPARKRKKERKNKHNPNQAMQIPILSHHTTYRYSSTFFRRGSQHNSSHNQ